MSKLIVPQWPLPKGVAACSSTRIGGVSLPPYDSLNLGAHCGDNPDHVEENRKRLFAAGICLLNRSGLSRYTAKMCLILLANLMPQNEQMPLIAIRPAGFAQ